MVRFRKKLRICLVVKDELERVFLLKISFLFNFLTRARERMFRMKNFRSTYRKNSFSDNNLQSHQAIYDPNLRLHSRKFLIITTIESNQRLDGKNHLQGVVNLTRTD